MTTENKLPGIRRDDLRKCDHCGEGLMNGNQICAYRVEVTQFIADPKAINEIVGLEIMLGHPGIAHVMGTDPQLFNAVSRSNALLCQNCFMEIDTAEAWEDGGKHGTGGTA